MIKGNHKYIPEIKIINHKNRGHENNEQNVNNHPT